MSARLDALIGHDYSVRRFAELAPHYQLAIVWRTVMECDGWQDIPTPEWTNEDDAKAGLASLMPEYVDRHGEELFGIVTLSSEGLIAAVMRDEEIASSYASWEDYHAAYTRGPTPKHPEANRWPVLLSSDDSETIWDGWHRFHSYIRDGAQDIPAVFYPLEHHNIS